MKKVFLTLALAAFAFAANAQFVVSGSLGFNHRGTKNTLDGTEYYNSVPGIPKSTQFNINLRGGYQINDKFQAGVEIGFRTNKNVYEYSTLSDPTKISNTDTYKSNAFGFGIYGRYDFLQFDKWNIFAEAEFYMAFGSGEKEIEGPTGTTTTDDPKTMDLNLAIVPGISYKINDNLSADLYLNFISLGFWMNKSTTETPTSGDDVTTDTYFGLAATSSQSSINMLLDNVSIGLTYRF